MDFIIQTTTDFEIDADGDDAELQTQQQLMDGEKSDNDSLWGDESDDDKSLVQKSPTREIYESDSENNDVELQNLLVSPVSTKELMENTPVHVDYNSEDDNLGNKKSIVKNESKKVKTKVELPRLTVVKSEIQAVKMIEAGPSESEIRRRKLIEIDSEELDERLDRLQKASLKNITSCTGLSKLQQKQQLRECREYLSRHIRLPDFEAVVRDSITKHNDRIYQSVEPSVDAVKYLQLNEDQYSSDDEEEKEESVEKQPKAIEQIAVRDAKAVIVLSDSDDSDDEEEEEVAKVESAVVTSKAVVQSVATDTDIRRQAYLAKMNKPKSARAALLISLRQKVLETAGTNYCNEHHIQNEEQLVVHMQIVEKSRVLVDLLKERHDTRSLAERESRRARYQNLASADDDEFDEDDDDYDQLAEGAFMTDEAREALLKQLSGENDEEEEEEEENIDDWQADDEQDEGEDVRGEDDSEHVPQEERTVVKMEAVASHDSIASHDVEQDNDDESEQVRRKGRGGGGGGHNVVMDEDVETLSSSASNKPLVQYGRVRPVTSTQKEEEDGEAQETILEKEDDKVEENVICDEVQTATSKSKNKVPKVTGNSLYRLQLEEEDRRARSRKKSGLLDEEAEEEEEEDYQRGLGDFGFGNLTTMREMDEEKDALRLRKGDLDHIVDDVSDGEGDEEEAERQRVAMEIREDTERTLAVIAAVTEGRTAQKKKKSDKTYSFDLLAGGLKKKIVPDGGDSQEVDVEQDPEELLQKGISAIVDRERSSKRNRHNESDDSSESEGEADDDDDRYAIVGAENMTEQERQSEHARLLLQREQDRADAKRCKLIERQTKMKREMRRQQANGGIQMQFVPSFESQHSLLDAPLLTLDPTTTSSSSSTGEPVKRRTSLAPRKAAPLHGSRPPAVHRTNTHSVGAVGVEQNKNVLVRRATLQQSSSSSLHYNG